MVSYQQVGGITLVIDRRYILLKENLYIFIVNRLMDEAFARNIPVAICSTSNEASVTTIAQVLLGPDRVNKIRIYAGDVVQKKKPAPDIYMLAAKELGVAPERCIVIEDSEIGLHAAKAANMTCIITKSVYTCKEDFTSADMVVNNLDDPVVNLEKLENILASKA
jgi:beta-phosphoglucomutase-like phosphatase (HAD superfamily)